jgi:hypothetical protein
MVPAGRAWVGDVLAHEARHEELWVVAGLVAQPHQNRVSSSR